MNRQSSRVFLILLLVIVVACVPAQAVRGGQSTPSSMGNAHGTQVNVSPGVSAAASTESAGKVPATDTGRIVSLSSLVQDGPEVKTSDTTGRPSATDKSTQAGPASSSGPSSDSSGRSDVSNNGRSDAAGGAQSPRQAAGENAAGMPDTARSMGSLQGTEREDIAGIPDNQAQSRESGKMAGMMVLPGGVAVARSVSGNENSNAPVPNANHGSFPYRHHHGPPAQSGSYPCGPAQASPLPQAPGQTRDESKEETPSRQRSKRIGFLSWILDPIVPDAASSSFPLQSLFPLNMLVFGGFRRISKKNVLEHGARNVIYQAITATPGIDVKTLTGMTGINENTLRYHLDRLVATGKISCFTRPGVVRYFQNQGAYNQFEHRVFHYLWTDTPRGILWLLFQHPGLTRQHIADALMIAGPSVTRQMDNLTGDGIVENRFPGRSNHYYLTQEAALTIEKVMSKAPVMMHKETVVMPISASAG